MFLGLRLKMFVAVIYAAFVVWPFQRTTVIKAALSDDSADSCTEIAEIKAKSGVITSPGYPKSYRNHTSCKWHILGDPGDIITISFDDIDIEGEDTCNNEPCCQYDWLKIWSLDGRQEQYCGRRKIHPQAFISKSHKVWIKFHTAVMTRGGRGFKLSYVSGPENPISCEEGQVRCMNKKCILSSWQCNGVAECEDVSDEKFCDDTCIGNQRKCREGGGCYYYPHQWCDRVWHCSDGSDELGCDGCPPDMFSCMSSMGCYAIKKRCDGILDCSNFSDELNCSLCGPNMTRCGPNSNQCYNPFRQRCDMVRDCAYGEDEWGCVHSCPNGIQCPLDNRCYTLEEQCNGIAQCSDSSDEKNCGHDLCRSERGGFLCDNGHCIREAWKCDHTDDCGDSSDEINCLKNSVITAAVMGSLVCGLLLVIAVSCTCRLYALRTQEPRESSPDTPLFRLEEEFFYREPPPSYAVAVGSHTILVENSHCRPERHHSHRSRRLHRSRRRPPTPPAQLIPNGNGDFTSESSDSRRNSSPSPVISVRPLSVQTSDTDESSRAGQSQSSIGAVRLQRRRLDGKETEKVESPSGINESSSISAVAKTVYRRFSSSEVSPNASGECIVEVHSQPSLANVQPASTESLDSSNACDCDTEPLIS